MRVSHGAPTANIDKNNQQECNNIENRVKAYDALDFYVWPIIKELNGLNQNKSESWVLVNLFASPEMSV